MLLYDVALREAHGIQPLADDVCIVVIYFGSALGSSRAGRMHGKLLAPYDKAIFLDMNHLDGTALHHGDLAGALLGLTRRDATDLSMFLAVHNRIMTEVSKSDVRSQLLIALFCASLNKRDILEALERRNGSNRT